MQMDILILWFHLSKVNCYHRKQSFFFIFIDGSCRYCVFFYDFYRFFHCANQQKVYL